MTANSHNRSESGSNESFAQRSQSNPPGLKIQPRDRGMLETVAKLKMALAEDVAGVCGFESADQARRRLERFVKANYLRKWEKALGQKTVYAIKRRGLQLASEASEYDLSHIKPPRDLDRNIEHLHVINTIRIALARYLPDAGGYLSWWKSDWELADNERIVPDALLQIEWQGTVTRIYCLEVEWATRAPKQFLNKILNYRSYQQQQRSLYGYHDFTLLVACQSEERLERYLQSLHAVTDKSWVWLASCAAITRSGCQSPIWKGAADGQYCALCDLPR